jgi:hypothetical protein
MDPNDEAAIAREVEALGFEGADVEVEGNVVRVDGDIILYRDKLLDGLYEPVETVYEPSADGGVVQKGYQRRQGVVTSGYTNIKLTWGTGSNVPTPQIRDAFIHAAGDFNSTAGSALRLSQKNTGPAVQIKMFSAFWPLGTKPCAIDDIACAEWPVAGKPGHTIYIKESPEEACPTWTTSQLARTARHELMHAFGVTHPGDGDHVPKTGKCGASVKDCAGKPDYHTLMGMYPTPSGKGKCEVTQKVLQTDDKLTLTKLYPAKVPSPK